MKRLNTQGFSHIIAIALIVAVVGIVGFTGYRVMQANDTTSTSATADGTTPQEQAVIDADTTLKAADTTLGDVATDLDSSLDVSTLDTDINALY